MRIKILVAVAAVALAACGGSSTPASTKTAGGDTATIGLAKNGSLGTILVDAKGDTVYLFEKDTGSKSACTGECATNWPPVRATGTPTIADGLSGAVATTPRSDGAPQVTYAGHPLYRFQGDSKPGDANGQGVNAYGAKWYVVSSSGSAVTKAGSSGSSGY
jgi:predicted lipoprotein with Yx(FWY)xxD motif